MTRQKLVWAILFASAGYATVPAQAVTTVYLSAQASGALPVMGLLHERVPADSQGELHVWIDSSVRLSGVSLDLVETGGAIEFTGAAVSNPNNRWMFTESPVVTESSITSIGGAATPGVVGNGIGVGAPESANVLFATVNYRARESGVSELRFRIGANGIADWDGNYPHVCFGRPDCGQLFPPEYPPYPVVGRIEVIPEPPTFYVSTQSEAATPGLLDLSGLEPGSTGTLHIWADSDIRLSGVSLDVVEVGGAIKFTGATILNPLNRRWAITDNPVVTDSLITDIAGGVLPNGGQGIGNGSIDGAKVLVASIDYTAIRPGHSSLFLRVGELVIADWDGNNPNVHFGTASSPAIPGGIPGGMGAVGTIEVIPEPATVSLVAMAIASLAGAPRRRKADSSAAFQSLPTRS